MDDLPQLETQSEGQQPRPLVPSPHLLEPTHNFPPQLSSFVGRHEEVSELRRLLVSTRLLTLTGPGGVGKTRLCLAIGEAVVADYADGVWLVELGSLGDPALVPSAVGAVLGVRESARPLLEQMADVLHTRAMLLVLDNCEHLVQSCAELADTLLRACPKLHIGCTTREPLNVSGEVIWRVPGLRVTGPNGSINDARQETEAVRLFLERARWIASGFRLTEHNRTAIAEICHRLDGLPLAIDLTC